MKAQPQEVTVGIVFPGTIDACRNDANVARFLQAARPHAADHAVRFDRRPDVDANLVQYRCQAHAPDREGCGGARQLASHTLFPGSKGLVTDGEKNWS